MSRFIPPRALVALYLCTAHVSLACAFFLTAWDPRAVAGFFYHARIVAIVHLVTIGWIAMSILGSLYVVLPMACGLELPARRRDYVAWSLVAIGLVGMVAHFWIGEFSGMAWSAGTAATGIVFVVMRAALAFRRAKMDPAVRMHLYLAAMNLAGAVTMGVLLGIDKAHAFLPGYVLSNVFAHAHLAAVGWVCLTIMAFAHRLLPMVLPSEMPSGRSLYVSGIVLEAGIVGLFVTLVTRTNAVPFAVLIVVGFLAFGRQVVWMLEHPRRPPHHRSRPDFALPHLMMAAVCLLFACVCGIVLVAAPVSEATLRVALLYGVLGLVGCLAQAIVGFERRILPMASACWAMERSGGVPLPALPSPAGTRWIFYAWLCGVPLVAAGFLLDGAAILAAGAWILFAACVAMFRNLIVLLAPWRYAVHAVQAKGPASRTAAGP